MRMPTAFLPEEDQGMLLAMVQLPTGSTMERTQAVMKEVQQHFLVNEKDAVESCMSVAGYSMAGNPDKPDIAVVVLVHNKGEGAIWAAPIFRRIMEIYFYGKPQTYYRWESSMGVANPDYGLPVTPTPAP